MYFLTSNTIYIISSVVHISLRGQSLATDEIDESNGSDDVPKFDGYVGTSNDTIQTKFVETD